MESAQASTRRPWQALLLTDVVDSTKLAEQLGAEANGALWAEHDRVARKLLAEQRGFELERTDGIGGLFPSVDDALAFATAYHAATAALSPPLVVRAALHAGDLTVRENPPEHVARGAKRLEVDGLGVAVAARVLSVCGGGSTLLTADRPGARSQGHWRLKGVSEPVELFAVGDGAAPQDAAKAWRVVQRDGAWVPAREVPHRLPAERDAFVGRAADLRALADLLDGARLVSVLGLGGTGKTRLVTRFAWTWLGDYPGGAWFCDLSEARSVDGICHAVAAALDVPLGKNDPIAQLGHAIAGRGACLVVLDNFEQVARHAPDTVGRWLDRARDARFVVTTREVLGLPGESALPLAPLAADDSVALFVARARQAKPDFAADDEASIRALVTLLDHLPLAIELAAARARVMAPKALLERMSQRFKLLASSGGRHSRQATLRATFDWSWELLTEDERSALAQLSVFEGGFTLEAAEAVLTLADLWPADAVQALVDRSWVRRVADDRFDLLVSVQEYAAEKLDAAGHRAGAEARHGAHFATFGADDALDALDSHGGVARRRALRQDLDNIVAACRRAIARGEVAEAVATELAAASTLEHSGPASALEALAAATLALALPPRARARVERTRGSALQSAGRVPEARASLQRALGASREARDRRAEGGILGQLGVLDMHAGRHADARAWYEQALAANREAGNRSSESVVLGNMGILASLEGRLDEARAAIERALAIARAVGAQRVEASTLANLSAVHANSGRLEEALAYCELALAAAREIGNRSAECTALTTRGVLRRAMGRLDEAVADLELALELQRRRGDRTGEGMALDNLGAACETAGRLDEARAWIEAALVLHREAGHVLNEGQSLGNLGTLLVVEGRWAEARAPLERACAIHAALGFTLGQANWLWGLAQIAHAEGSTAWVSLADEAVSVAAPYPGTRAEALSVRASLRLAAGDVAAARADVDEARALGQPGAVGAGVAVADARVCRAEGRAEAARAALREAEALADAARLHAASQWGRELAEVRALLEASP